MRKYRKPGPSDLAYIKGALKLLEDSYGVRLPPLYHQFLLEHVVGEYVEKWEAYLDEYLRPTSIHSATIQTPGGQKIPYYWLNSPNQLIHDLKYYPKAKDLLEQSDLLRIGHNGDGKQGIFVGVGSHNEDQIFSLPAKPKGASGQIFSSIDEFVNAIELKVRRGCARLEILPSKRYTPNDRVSLADSEVLAGLTGIDQQALAFVSADVFLHRLNEVIKHVRG